jgi:hypothetical protein
MPRSRPSFRKLWLTPIAAMAVLAFVIFAGFYALDFFVLSTPSSESGGLSHYFGFESDKITDALPALGSMTAAVLGIVITVVSIIVQLSADRYTGVAQMFLRDKVNLVIMAYFVLACVFGVWVSVALREHFVPRAAVVTMMFATSLGLIFMLPYFAYVFWFLEPSNIVARIRRDAVQVVTNGAQTSSAGAAAELQGPVISAMEELTDITSNSISGKDKIIASRSVDALKDFALEYLEVKPRSDHPWYQIGPLIRQNPDFVAMDPESLADLEKRRTWVEWKILRQYLGIFNEALSPMPDINYLIAINTRYIGEAAGEKRDNELMMLVFRYLNSYLRATLNARNVRTAYNVLNQYRLLVEAMLRQHNGAMAIEGVRFMKYYGHVSYNMDLTFVAETVGYDVGALCQFAHEIDAPEEEEMLGLFLELDQPLLAEGSEKALVGVRKAQVKLATHYLSAGAEDQARRIADDLRSEPPERLLAIRDQLERVTTKDFWEIIDRGRNFEYMPADKRAHMATFFDWLGAERP